MRNEKRKKRDRAENMEWALYGLLIENERLRRRNLYYQALIVALSKTRKPKPLRNSGGLHKGIGK